MRSTALILSISIYLYVGYFDRSFMKEQRPYNGAKIVSLTNGTETTANLHAKNNKKNLDTNFTKI